MNYSLTDIGLLETDLDELTIEGNIEVIFDAMASGSSLFLHINSAGNLAELCPGEEKRGVFTANKIDGTIASLSYIERVGGKFYSATFNKTTTTFSGWIDTISLVEKESSRTPLEIKVDKISDALGDVTLMDHYGGNVVDVLNKYTRQVLIDSSTEANVIELTEYYGNIHAITYNTPITVQVNNNSLDYTGTGTHPKVIFKKDIYDEGVFVETLVEEYKLKVVDLMGDWNNYRDMTANDMTKNIFYNLVKRQILIDPNDPNSLEEVFVLMAQSGESEFASLSNRITTVESYFQNEGSKISLTELISSSITGTTLNISGESTLGNVTAGNITGSSINGNSLNITNTTNLNSLIISNNINLASCSVSLKTSPGGGDIISKTYVDNSIANAKTDINSRIKMGTANPSGGSSGDIYLQY